MHYHLEAPNKENVFLVAFRTHPMNSTGVAHILEHTVLCGSERYPVRDPFFLMLRRSLNTFMNAFTSSDYTAYPFASQNRKDFVNLLDIYLDAVFAPCLEELDFCQEGHRLEFENPQDPESGLIYKGVVYNEMKGDASSPDSLMYDFVKTHLFPTTTYHYNSGGDPAEIPALTYDDFLLFYRAHYHPSNAIFMTFGDMPVSELQGLIEERALHRFSSSDKHIAVAPEQRFSEPQSFIEPYSLEKSDTADQQCHLVMAWLLGKGTDLKALMQAHLISDLLLETSASPLRYALESSGLGASLSPLSGLEDSHLEMSFMCGLKGCKAEDAEKIEALILDSLDSVATSGVPVERLEAVLYQLELHQREIGGDSAPYGLQLMFSCLSAAIHRGDPVKLLDMDPILADIREDIQDPEYIPGLIRNLLLDNPHRVRVLAVPDSEMTDRQQAEEKARLQKTLAGMGEDERQHILDQARDLKERQDTPDDIDILPKVGIEDVSPEYTEPAATSLRLSNKDRVSLYQAGTNGLVYQQMVLPIPSLDAEVLPLLPVYTEMLGEVGSGGRSYIETQHLLQSACAGINAYSSFRQGIAEGDPLSAYLTVSTRSLAHSFSQAADLFRQGFYETGFGEHQRMTELVKRLRVRREASLHRNGHLLALQAASRHVSAVTALSHRISGLGSIHWIRDLEKQLVAEEEQERFSDRLTGLHDQMSQNQRQFLLISDTETSDQAFNVLDDCYASQSLRESQPDLILEKSESVSPLKEAWITTTQVNFCAAVLPTVPESHPDSPALTVLAGILRNGYLHGEIREKGGAYGGGATHDASNGLFRFYSYRDPRVEETFNVFEGALPWLESIGLQFAQVEESILGIIGSLDSPSSPAGEARHAFHQALQGRDLDHRRQYRAAVLSVTVEEVLSVASRYLHQESSRAVVTGHAHAERLAEQGFAIEEI